MTQPLQLDRVAAPFKLSGTCCLAGELELVVQQTIVVVIERPDLLQDASALAIKDRGLPQEVQPERLSAAVRRPRPEPGDTHSAAPPSPFIRRFNRVGERRCQQMTELSPAAKTWCSSAPWTDLLDPTSI